MTASYQHYATHDESEYPHLWEGVVGAWAPCLGPSGTRLHDHSGRANWGTLGGFTLASDWAVDAGKYALLFGPSKSIELKLDGIVLQDFTISFWVRPTSTLTVNRTVMQKSSGGLSLILLNNTVFSGRSQSTGLITWTIPAIGQVWNHFAFVRSGSSARVWSNGVESSDGAKPMAGNFVVDCLGSIISPSNVLPGYVDDLLVFDRAFEFNWVRQIYQADRGGMYTPRRRRRAYSFGPLFQAGWARGSNVILQPCGVS